MMSVNFTILSRIAKGILCVLVPWMAGGCAYTLAPIQGVLYTGVTTPVTYRDPTQNCTYEVLGTVEGKATAISFLGIVATGDASVNSAYHAALAQQPSAEGLIDVCIDQTHSSVLGLYASYTTTVRAKAVKWVAYTASKETFSQVDVSQPPQLPAPRQQQNLLRPLLQGPIGHGVILAYSDFAGDREGGGLRFGYAMRRKGTRFAFSPAISHGVLTDERSFSYLDYDFNTGRYVERQGKSKTHIRMIPVELNVTTSFASFSQFQANLPQGLNPYAEGGLTYFIRSEKYEEDSQLGSIEYGAGWDFFEVGLNLGIGAEYFYRSDISVSGGLKRYIVFGKDLGFWNWQVGVNFYSGQ